MKGSSSQIHRLSEASEVHQLVDRFGFDISYTQVSPGQLDLVAYEIRVGDCLVFRERYECHVMAHGTSTPRGFGVMVVESGTVRFFGDQVSPKKIVLFPPHCEIDAVGFPGLRLNHFVLPRDRVAAAASEWNVEIQLGPRAMVVEPGIDRLRHFQAILEKVIDILDRRDLTLWDDTEEELLNIFVGLFDRSALGTPPPAISAGRAAKHAMNVRSYVQSRSPDQLDFDCLARDLGIGRPHLNRCFRDHYGVSLHEFVHLCRLHRARALLMKPASQASVTETAYSSGFNHLGRFSAEYRHLFGETPSQTLHKRV